MLSPYGLPPSSISHTRKQKTPNNTKHDIKMTSNDHKIPQKTSKDENDKAVAKKYNQKIRKC